MVRDIHDRDVRESYRMHEAKKLTEKDDCNWQRVKNWADMQKFAQGTKWVFAHETGEFYYKSFAKNGKFFKCGEGKNRQLTFAGNDGRTMICDVNDRCIG